MIHRCVRFVFLLLIRIKVEQMRVLYQWGIIYDSEQQKRIQSHVPKQIFASDKLEQVTCGTNFTLILDSTHRVYVIGDEPKYGRLGLGDEQTIAPKVRLIQGEVPPIGWISSGPSTSILLTVDQRELWGFGKGIGGQAERIFQTEESITHCACGEGSMVVVINHRLIKERRFQRQKFQTDWIDVYQLTDPNDQIHHIDLGSSVSGFVTEQGHVYLWGSTIPTSGSNATVETFRAVPIDQPLQKDLPVHDRPRAISCSQGQFHAHILLLTESGCIYALGSNYKAKLGVNQEQLFTSEWTLIESTKQCPFAKLATGGIHSSALARDGRLFTWGCGSDGRLGHAEAQGHRYLYKETEPRAVETLAKHQVIALATSYYHMAAIVDR